jgi:cytochrome c oxidase subunit 1
MMNAALGKLHFWGSLIGMNGIFLPMLIEGLAGVNRRLYDGGRTYTFTAPVLHLYSGQWWSTVLLGLVQVIFIVNLVWSLARGRRTAENPWQSTTLEWATTSPPPHANFPATPRVHRGPYDYSPPGLDGDFVPQQQP